MVERIGNWGGIAGLIDNLEKECKLAVDQSLMRFGLKAEGIAKKHIRDQDLDWDPLSPAYLAAKLRKGYSEKTMIRTSTYFQNITSWKQGDTAYVGVKRETLEKDGKPVYEIARLHEYGSLNGIIPARPLWQPTLEEVVEWHKEKNQPAMIFLQNIRKRYRV